MKKTTNLLKFVIMGSIVFKKATLEISLLQLKAFHLKRNGASGIREHTFYFTLFFIRLSLATWIWIKNIVSWKNFRRSSNFECTFSAMPCKASQTSVDKFTFEDDLFNYVHKELQWKRFAFKLRLQSESKLEARSLTPWLPSCKFRI